MATPEMVRAEDAEEQELARVDRLAHAAYGRDESMWTPAQRDGYVEALNTVHAHLGETEVSGS